MKKFKINNKPSKINKNQAMEVVISHMNQLLFLN